MTNASDNDIRRRLRAMGLIVPADLGDIKTVSAASATDISALASCPNLEWVCAASATDISAWQAARTSNGCAPTARILLK